MPRPKSFLPRLAVEKAARAHNCQHNASHRLRMGDVRLKVTIERSSELFCPTCAIAILRADIDMMTQLIDQLTTHKDDPEIHPDSAC